MTEDRDRAGGFSRHEHMPLSEHEAHKVEMIELARLRRRSPLERGVRYTTAGLGIALGAVLLAGSIPRGAPAGIVLGVVVVVFGVLQWRQT